MKKLLSLVLALVMLALPGLSVAEDTLGIIGGADGPTSLFVGGEISQSLSDKALAAGRRVNQAFTITEFSGLETGDPMTDAALMDLFKALGLRTARQGDEFEMALTLSGKDALDVGMAVNGEDIYVKSDLLGGTVVINENEVEPLMDRILTMMVLMETMTEEDAELLREQFAAMQESLTAVEEQPVEEPALLLETLNFSALEAMMADIRAKVVPLETIIVPRMCDPAVAGVQGVLTNEDMIGITKALCQFLLDNPALMDYIGAMFGYPTEEQIAAEWETAGQLYMTFGIYKSEEEFRAAQPTFASAVREVMAEADAQKIIDGDYVVTLYADEAGVPVYGTLTLPLYIAGETLVEGEAAPGETMTVSMTYTRQTVAQGVAHVCNIDVDGTGVTIDALVNEGATTVTVTGVEPEFEPTKLLDVSVNTAENATTPGVTDIDVSATIYDGADNAVLDIVYDGEYEFTDVRKYAKGKLTLTAYEYSYMEEAATIPVIDEETGETEYIEGTWTVSGGDVEPSVLPTAIVMEFSTETLINGVDYTGMTTYAIEAGGVRVGLQAVSETTDPETSIMAGEVVRPAELTDADFSNWFVGVINAANTWVSNLMLSLPESVLTLMIYSGMM